MAKGRTLIGLLVGLGVGVGLTLLFAPQSGEDTREWIAKASRRATRRLGKQGRRSLERLRDVVAKGQGIASRALHARGNSPEFEAKAT
jgi:gas vesicle protein